MGISVLSWPGDISIEQHIDGANAERLNDTTEGLSVAGLEKQFEVCPLTFRGLEEKEKSSN